VDITKAASEKVAKTSDIIAYTIVLNVTSGPANNIQVTDVLPAHLNFVGFGNAPSGGVTAWNVSTKTLSWSFAFLPLGPVTLTYEAQVDSYVQQGAVLTNNAQVTYSGLAVPKSTSVNVTMAMSFMVHVGVYNEAGELVKQIWVQQLSQQILSFDLLQQPTITSLHGQVYIEYKGQQIATWDGTNSAGDPVTNGEYYVKVDNVDPFGNVTTVSQTVMVSRAIAKVTVNIYNEAGEIVRHLYSYVDDPSNNPLSGIQFSSSVIQPSQTSSSNGTVAITSSNGLTLVWDGRSDSGSIVTNGQYQIELHATDGKGGEQIITRSVAVESADKPATNGNVFAGPNVLKGGVTSTLVQVHSSVNYTLTARLYNTAGELIRQAVTGQPGSNQVMLNVNGMASGLYFVVVDLTNAQGGSAGHQVTKILIQH